MNLLKKIGTVILNIIDLLIGHIETVIRITVGITILCVMISNFPKFEEQISYNDNKRFVVTVNGTDYDVPNYDVGWPISLDKLILYFDDGSQKVFYQTPYEVKEYDGRKKVVDNG